MEPMMQVGWVELVGGPKDGLVIREVLVPHIFVCRDPLSEPILRYARSFISGDDVFIGDHEHPIPYYFLGEKA
jgi:hypothetical protein